MATTTVRQKTSLRDLITRFINRPNLSERTRESYANLLGNFEGYARAKAFPGPQDITREHVREFLDYVATEEYRLLEFLFGHYRPEISAEEQKRLLPLVIGRSSTASAFRCWPRTGCL